MKTHVRIRACIVYNGAKTETQEITDVFERIIIYKLFVLLWYVRVIGSNRPN